MNTYRLTRPIGAVKEVQIKSFKMKFLLGMEADSVEDGTSIYKMLSTITDINDYSVFRQMTVMDAILIMFAAWRKSYHKDMWLNKYLKCDCGAAAINLAKHSVTGEYALPDVYTKLNEVAAYNDDDQLQRFQVKLRPLCLDLIEKGMIKGGVSNSQILFAQVEAVDGAGPSEDMPLSAWSQINDMLPNDMEQYQRLTQVKLNCAKCSKELVSEIGFSNFDWIQCK